MNNPAREFSSLRRFGFAILLLAAASSAWGQATVTGMNLVSSTRVGRTTFDYTYTINVTNGATGLANAVATVTSSAASTVIVQGSVALGTLAAGASTTSTNTFTMQQDRTVAFNPASLTWAVTGTAFDVVPNVVGATQAAATSAITGAGLVVGTVTTASSSTVTSGDVISETPGASTNVAVGSAVNLTVSTGPALGTVPNVVGLSQSSAAAAIAGAGLVIGSITEQSSTTVTSGVVISQTPVSGSPAAAGVIVSLIVSAGPFAGPDLSGVLQPVLDPEIIGAGATTTFTVSSAISLPNVVATSVNALLVDSSGNQLAVLGAMNDSGINGDQVPGDGVYTGTFTLTQPAAGRVYVRVSAQSSTAGTVESAIASIAVLPQGVPTGLYAPNLSQFDVDPVTGSNIVSGAVLACFTAANDPTGIVNATAASNMLNAAIVGVFATDDNCYQLQLPAGSGPTVVRQAIGTLLALPSVTDAEPDFELQGLGTPCAVVVCTDASYRLLQFSTALSATTGAYAAPAIGAVGVAVVDSGVDYNVVPNVVLGPRLVQPESQDPMDDSSIGHGTAVAGIVAGTAPSSPIYAVKSLNSNLAGSVSTIHWGIHYAARHLGVKVINLSFGAESATGLTPVYSKLIRDEIFSALNTKNCTVIVSAGDDYSATVLDFPANLGRLEQFTASNSGLVAVGSVVDSGTGQLFDTIDTGHPGSNPNPDLAAPGVNITTSATMASGLPSNVFSGTSAAAPFVSGTAALVRSINPQWTPPQIATQLINSVQPVYLLDSDNNVISLADQQIGAGRLDPVAALGVIRFTYNGHNQTVTLSTTLSLGIQFVSAGSNTYALGSFYSIFGNTTPCEARVTNACTADELLPILTPASNYLLTIEEVDDPPEDASGTITLTIPGLTFVSVQNSATGSIVNPTTASFSLIGGNGTLEIARFTLQQAQ